MKSTKYMGFAAVALSLMACWHSVPVQGAQGDRPEGSMASSEPKWAANIRTVPQTRFMALDTARDISSSSVEWLQGEHPGVSNINISFTYAGAEHSLSWGILFGTCGSASMPLLPVSSFPELEVSVGGHTEISTEISLDLPTSGNYHIDIYRDRRGGVEWLVGCGNLRHVAPG